MTGSSSAHAGGNAGKPPKEPLTFKEHVLAGAVAGLVEVLAMYPLDLVKTRFQLQKGGSNKYTTVAGTFRTIIKEEGFAKLYRGIASPILAEAPKRALKFASNETYKKIAMNMQGGKLTYTGAAWSGAMAGVTEAFVNCPFEVVKVRLQAPENAGVYKNFVDAVMKITNIEGPAALYKGFEAQIWRNAAWNGTYFAIIPFVKASLWEPETKPSELFRNFLAGFTGGTVATTINTPFDVVKSRLQNIKGTERPWAIPTLLQVAREEGVRALFKGYVPRILRLGPGGGIMLLAFDLVGSLLR